MGVSRPSYRGRPHLRTADVRRCDWRRRRLALTGAVIGIVGVTDAENKETGVSATILGVPMSPYPSFGLGDQQCITLPSSDAAVTLVRGNIASGVVGVVASTVLRAALIGGGLYIIGERKHLMRNSLAAASAIEAFVLAWVAGKNAMGEKEQQTGVSGLPVVGFP
jgi:hypothetical protein